MTTTQDLEEATTTRFELTDSNWPMWSAKMRATLIKKNLWRAVLEPRNAPPDVHAAAQAEMILRVQDQFIMAIEDAFNAAQAWENLRQMNERSGPSRRMIYKKDLASLKKAPEESLSSYISRVSRITHGLAATGAPVQNYEAVEAALLGLGEEYGVAKQILVNSGQTNITLSELLARLQNTEDYTAVNNGSSGDQGAVLMAKKKSYGKASTLGPRCYVCGQRGHVSRNCKDRAYASDSEEATRCHYCGKSGHLKRDCITFKRDSGQRAETHIAL